MRIILVSQIILLWSFLAHAELQAQTLGEESLYNNKVFTINNYKNSEGIKVRVATKYVGEPAKWPQVVYPYIQCEKAKGYTPIDLAGYLMARGATEFASQIGAPTNTYKNGVLHVCALENVNFDSENLFISVFEAGSDSCDRSKVMDLMFKIEELCKK